MVLNLGENVRKVINRRKATKEEDEEKPKWHKELFHDGMIIFCLWRHKGEEFKDSGGNPHSIKDIVKVITQEVEKTPEDFEERPKPQHNKLLEIN